MSRLLLLLALAFGTGCDTSDVPPDGEPDASNADASIGDGDASVVADASVDVGIDGGPAEPPSGILRLAAYAARGEPVTTTLFSEALEVERTRTSRTLSEPGRVVKLAWSYHLAGELPGFPMGQFAETLGTRLAYLVEFGEGTAHTRANGETLTAEQAADILRDVRAGRREVWGDRTRNNRELREAAALNLARIIFGDMREREAPASLSGFDLTALLDSPFVADAMESVSLAFLPNPGITSESYAIVTRDGAYKEGAAYLRFTYQALVPFYFFSHHYEGKNLFVANHGYGDGVSTRVRRLHRWLLDSQNLDGTWSSLDDAGRIGLGWILEPLVAHLLLDTSDEYSVRVHNRGSRRLSNEALCRNLGTGASRSLEEARQLCRDHCQGTRAATCRRRCDTESEIAAVLSVDADGLEAKLESLSCTDLTAERIAHYQHGGQLYLRWMSGVEARFTNQGNFWRNSGTDGCTTLPPVFGSLDGWRYRGCNHNRYDDQHFEVRVGDIAMLTGPGKIGYSGLPYDVWNHPRSYNAPSVGGVFAKVAYQGSEGSGRNILSREIETGVQLYSAPGDNVRRYVLTMGERYFVVVDVPQAGATGTILSRFRFRTLEEDCGAHHCDASFGEEPILIPRSTDRPTTEDAVFEPAVERPDVGVRFRKLTGTMAWDSAPGTCRDGEYQVRESSEILHRYCEMRRVRQRSTGAFGAAVLWPTSSGFSGAPTITTSSRANDDAPLTFDVDGESWRLSVRADGSRRYLQVEAR